MFKKINTTPLKTMILAAFLVGFSSIGYTQNIEINEIVDANEVEVPDNGEVEVPGSNEDSGGFDAVQEGSLKDKCTVPGDCSRTDDSARELTPDEEAKAIDNGWSN